MRRVRAMLPGLLLLLGLTSATLQILSSSVAEAVPQRPPNILFVIIDDIGVDQMRIFGYQLDNQAHTPTIDTIALGGVRFRNAWAMPECSPSRVSFFTGRYPMRTGVLNISLDNTLANSQMSPFEVTIPKVLRQKGYKNAFFGKWHLTGFTSNDPNGNPNPGNPFGNSVPRESGWDYFDGMLEGAPRGIDTTAGGVAATGTYTCGFVNDATSGACYSPNGSCTSLSTPGNLAGAGRACLEQGGILDPGVGCQSSVPANIVAGFNNFNGYYVAPRLINRENGDVELIAGFQENGNVKFPTDPRARGYLTTIQTNAAIDWIKQQDPKTPWMVTLSYSAAHLPAQQPPEALTPNAVISGNQFNCAEDLAQRELTSFMLEGLDTELGRLLVAVGLATHDGSGNLVYQPDATDTTIVVVGDNGSYLQTVRLPFDPTRGKGTVYQTGVWVPLIVAGPLVNGKNVGTEVPHMVNAAVDLFGLFGDVAGLDVRKKVPKSHTLDTEPLMPYLTKVNQTSIRKNNFTQSGTVLSTGTIHPCVLTIGPTRQLEIPGFEGSPGQKVCMQIFTFQELCETEGGQWFPNDDNCCQVVAQNPTENISILPFSQAAIRDDEFKLVQKEVDSCDPPGQLEVQYEFYEVNEAAPLPELDKKANNLLTSTSLPPQGLTPDQTKTFDKLLGEMNALLNSEKECPGDGNLDNKVDQKDIDNWQFFADTCLANPNECSSRYDMNLDAVTNEADLTIIEANLNRHCKK